MLQEIGTNNCNLEMSLIGSIRLVLSFNLKELALSFSLKDLALSFKLKELALSLKLIASVFRAQQLAMVAQMEYIIPHPGHGGLEVMG